MSNTPNLVTADCDAYHCKINPTDEDSASIIAPLFLSLF